ncbi:MAG: lytic transglycosylase domain-containing protein [SAR324 cluster bacterium]|nr:lytic transglycosylase domain-containing protein [SAR324 cluster bacterium]
MDRATNSRYLHYIHRVFYKYKLPPELAHLPILESCFDTRADSGSARGMWQFTKSTAKDYGLRVSWLSDDRLNWRKSTHSAARYLKKLGEMFDNNWELALAGYNGGPGYMSRQIKSQGTRNFWELELRKETHEYVPKFLAMLRVARKRYPELYFQGSPRAWATSG